MTEVTLDTGALIQLQRDRPLLSELLRAVHRDGLRLATSAPALVEFLGGSSPQLRPAAEWVSSHIQIASADEAAARRAAVLMHGALDASPTASPSAVDALVATEAERRGGRLAIAGDRPDLDALATASGKLTIVDLEALVR